MALQTLEDSLILSLLDGYLTPRNGEKVNEAQSNNKSGPFQNGYQSDFNEVIKTPIYRKIQWRRIFVAMGSFHTTAMKIEIRE